MSKKQHTTSTESLRLQNSAEEALSSVSGTIKSNEPVEDTPFRLIGFYETETEIKYFIALSKYRLQPEFNSREEAFEYIEAKSWHLIGQTISILAQLMLNHEEN